MKKFDEILDFLFHSRMGKGLLTLSLLGGSMVFGGCFALDCMAGCWGCVGCEDCASDCSDCNTTCNDIISGGGDCNTPCTALFGDGCTWECGNCGSATCNGWDCFTTQTCNDGGCSGCGGDCVYNCGNCSFYGGNVPIVDQSVTVLFIESNTHDTIRASTIEIPAFTSVTNLQCEFPSSAYFSYETILYSDEACTQAFTDSSFNILGGKSLAGVGYLYAKVTEIAYGQNCVIDFEGDLNGKKTDIDIPPVNAVVGQHVPSIDIPSFTGYVFDGLYVGSKKIDWTGDFHLYDIGTTSTEITITVKYVPATYRVSFVVEDDTAESGTETYGYNVGYNSSLYDELVKVDPSAATDNPFIGWSSEGPEYGNTVYTESQLKEMRVTQNIKLYAVYSHPVVITLYYSQGPGTDPCEVKKDDGSSYYQGETYVPSVPANVGINIFSGWYYDAAYRDSVGSAVLLQDAQCVLYAKWLQVTEYTIEYYDYEISPNALYREMYTYNENGVTPLWNDMSGYTPEGYKFVGWHMKSDLSDEPVTSLPAGTSGNLKLYAAYEPAEVTFRLNAAGGTVSPDRVTVAFGSQYSLPVPAYTGRDFVGWFLSNGTQLTDGNGRSLAAIDEGLLDYVVGGAVQATARWEISEYTLTFKDGDTVVAQVDCEYNRLPDMSSEPQPLGKEGHKFVGWFDGDEQFDKGKAVTSDRTFTARYEPETYQITLDADGGTVNGAETITVDIVYGQKINLPVAVNDGYVFDGWYTADGRQVTYFDGEMIEEYLETGNITLYARWIRVQDGE